MFKKLIETLVGGALGLTALYVVAKVAFEAGQDFANITNQQTTPPKPEYRETTPIRSDDSVVQNTNDSAIVFSAQTEEKTSVRPMTKLNTVFSLFKIFSKRNNRSVLGDLANNPEGHTLEAYVNEGEVHINIKKRRTFQPAAKSQTIMESVGT